jgi:hypothetical protein
MRISIKATTKKVAETLGAKDVDKLQAGVKYLCSSGQTVDEVYIEVAKKNVDRQVAAILRNVPGEGWTFTTFTLTKEQLKAVKELAASWNQWPIVFGYKNAMGDYLPDVELPENTKKILESITLTEVDLDY